MNGSVRYYPWLLLSLIVLLILALCPEMGRAESAAPEASIPSVDAALHARVIAEQSLVEAAEQLTTISTAQQYTAQHAMCAATNRVWSLDVHVDQKSRPLLGPVVLGVKQAATTASARVRVPILMYHHVADAPPDADAIRRDLSVSPAAFARQLEYLATHGYQAISLGDLANHLLEGKPLPSKPIILTFDDGYDDNYTQAFPILRRYRFTGTFFIITDLVEQPGYVTWKQLGEMSQAGMAIQAHGRTHADLSACSAEETVRQVVESRMILEERLGQPVRFYCYPSGRYTAQTVSILRGNGYVAAVTTGYGATHTSIGLFELSRVRVRGTDSLSQFIAKLETAP